MDEIVIRQLKCFVMTTSFASWSIYYNKLRNSNRSARYCNHYLSVCYTALSLILMLISTDVEMNPFPKEQCKVNNLIMVFSLAVTWGYCAFNLIWSMYYGENTIVYTNLFMSLLLLNHYIFLKTDNRNVIIKGVGYLELSNPSPRAKLYLKQLNGKKSMIAKCIELSIYSAMAFIRIVYGSYYLSAVLFNSFYDAVDKMAASYFYLIGILFLYKIVPRGENVRKCENTCIPSLQFYQK